MPDLTTSPSAVASPKDFDSEVARWQHEIELAEKECERWWKQCRKIDRRYRDQREGAEEYATRFNVLWSNIQTLLPAIYAKPPDPVVQRRFRDSDPVARAACEILQRNLEDAIEETELHGTIRQVALDYLLSARGTLWLRYEPHFSTAAQPGTAAPDGIVDTPKDEGVQVADDGEEAGEIVDWEEICADYVHYEDFLHSPARVWQDVSWVARRVRMTRDEGVARFGRRFKDVPLDWHPANMPDAKDGGPEYDAFKRATVWEIWSKPDRKVVWIAPGYNDKLLDKVDDPLRLRQFFPCPKPLYGTVTNNNLIPVPDYIEYQDQAQELDDLTGRISAITKAIKIAGVYDASMGAVKRLFDEGADNQLIPVEDWARFSKAGGGLEGTIDLLPMEEIANVLKTLLDARMAVKNDLYEETGIADILRGSTQPEETATAQRIKGRYATMRLSDRQTEVARFVRDTLRLMGEIIATHFSPETLALASNFQASEIAQDFMPPQQPGMPPVPPQMAMQMLLQQAIALLQDDKLRSFRIDIEDKSTIATEDAEEQAARVQFLEAVGKFLGMATTLPPQMAGPMGPMLGKMLLFGVRAFRAGTELESALEEAVAKLQQASNQPPPPDPKLILAQAQAQKAQAEAQATQAALPAEQQKNQLEAAKLQADIQQSQKQNEQDDRQHLIDLARLKAEDEERQYQREKDARDHQIELMKLQLDQQKLALEERKVTIDSAHRSREADLQAAQIASSHEQGMRDSDIKEKQQKAKAE